MINYRNYRNLLICASSGKKVPIFGGNDGSYRSLVGMDGVKEATLEDVKNLQSRIVGGR